jgi:KaiC/GvpD/RAD55 family RecA-like ATPase
MKPPSPDVDPANFRHRTGLPPLDDLLGGGLVPGTLTVVVGATGIGKTQLGLHFANAGRSQEGEAGILLDLTTRGDSQNQAEYARRLFNWRFREFAAEANSDASDVWQRDRARHDYLHLFRRSGRRVTQADLRVEEWQEWNAELARKLDRAVHFFYGNFVQGVRRCVLDGVEPTERASDSFQFQVIDYVYHQILRKDDDWVARDLFRVQFRSQADQVSAHRYDHREIACVLLYTSHETMLDDLLVRPIDSGDALSNANTIILMGKVRDGLRMRRALHVAKHRGSACDDRIVPFEITERGLVIADGA